MIARLPGQLRRSLAWDQGSEMAQHAGFTLATGLPGLLLRPALPLAARQQREHQRTAAPVLPQRESDRLPHANARTTSTRSPRTQRPTPRNPRPGAPLAEKLDEFLNQGVATNSETTQNLSKCPRSSCGWAACGSGTRSAPARRARCPARRVGPGSRAPGSMRRPAGTRQRRAATETSPSTSIYQRQVSCRRPPRLVTVEAPGLSCSRSSARACRAAITPSVVNLVVPPAAGPPRPGSLPPPTGALT